MLTTILNAYSIAYPSVSLRIRARVLDYTGTSVIAQQIEDAPHPIRTWSFPGLPRANYTFSLDVINAGGIAITNLAYFNVVPGQLGSSIVRGDEQYKVGALNSGLVAGTSSATFDGTGDKPDFRGWEVWASISAGPNNPLVKGLDFSWNKDTGVLKLLQIGDAFQENAWWHFKFDSKDSASVQSIPTVFDYQIRLATFSTGVAYEDFGNAIITEPEDELITLTLPDITTIPVGRELKIEFGGTDLTCVKLLAFGTDTLPLTFGMPGESCIVYRYQRLSGNNEWRVKFTGFAKLTGSIVYNDQIQPDLALLYKRLDNQVCNIRQHARLYEYVLNLPPSQVCNFADWNTGNNKYLYSLANIDGDFHVPDRRGLSSKNTNAGPAGVFEDWATIEHKHEQTIGTIPSTIFGRGLIGRLIGNYNGLGTSGTISDLTSIQRNINGTEVSTANLSTEVKVKSIFNNQYVVL
jgi:hypothetical protein